ncbi:MAG: hypothetical protein K6U89_09420 [Chloroflexi bacterium]|nr:hypothetical protein [Chloroflexota bacterium]
MPPLSRRHFLVGAAALASLPTWPCLAAGAALPEPLIEETAALAASSLTARLDRDRHYQPYFHLDLGSDPPEGRHSSWDYVDTAGRFVAAFLALHALDIPVDREAEEGLRQFFLAQQAPDGLFYDQAGEWGEEAAETFAQSRALLGLVALFQAGIPGLEARIERLVAALSALLEPLGPGGILPGRRYRGGWLDRSLTAAGASDGIAKPGYGALAAEPLLRYAARSGSRAAAQLADWLLEGVLASQVIAEDGRYLGHTHSWGILPVTLALLERGQQRGDETLIERARRVFEFTIGQSTPWGWVPDGIGFAPGYPGGWFCETCGLADLIVLGLRLGQLGYTPAWGHVERFLRNQLVANQFREVERVIPPEVAARSTTNAAAILRGSFEAWARPNSLLGGFDLLSHGGLEACCTAAAVLALHQAAQAAITVRAGATWVELPLTLRSPFATVTSFEPAVGRLEVELPAGGALRLRLPVAASSPTVAVAGVRIPRQPVGGVLALDSLPPGSRVTLEYALLERWETREAGELTVHARWRGATVMRLDPPGSRYPIFRRA